MYLVWINPPINFTFSDDSVFLKKILAGDINYLNLLVYFETTSVKCIYVCIIHRKNIVIESKTNEKMDSEEHYPQNSKSHCIISY